MSIASEISRLSSNISDSLDAVADKGVTVPSDSNSDDLPGLIALINTGDNVTIEGGPGVYIDENDYLVYEDSGSGSDSGGTIYQDTDGYLHLSEDNKNVISIVDTLDTAGGTIRTITSKVDSVRISLSDFASGAEPTGELDITGLTICEYGFANRNGITSVIGNGQFANPNPFYHCNGIKTVHISLASTSGSNFFNGCAGLKIAVLTQAQADGYGMFTYCSALEIADINVPAVSTNYFASCTKLSTIILRKTSSIIPLHHVNYMSGSPFSDGKAGGTLYVPSELITDYQAATNWSTILSYGDGSQNRILPIEGSIYETQYADGTPIT